MRSSRPLQARRRRLAVLASLLWVLGFEVLPNLHLSLHRRLGAHRHDGDEAGDIAVRVHRDRAAHVHDGVVHHHAGGAALTPPSAPRTSRHEVAPVQPAPFDPGHGAHSLAHRGLALAPPAPPLLVPLPVDHRPVAVAHVISQTVAVSPPPEAGARAPPA